MGQLNPHPGSRHDNIDLFDVAVVGAGFVGICIARDLASLGYRVMVLEGRGEIGGVWATNDYPGLRLHGPGSCYRCLSLAPAWTREHPASEWYRPSRDEILAYLKAMSEHPLVTIKCDCRYLRHDRAARSLAITLDDGTIINARAIVFSTGFNITTCGDPHFPCDPALAGANRGPVLVHSSNLDAATFQRVLQSKRTFVIGSGKAAIDILTQLKPGANVIWAHRGHTTFLDRDSVHDQFATDGRALNSTIRKLYLLAARSDKHWTEIAADEGVFLTCGYPLTSRPFKWGGGIAGSTELERASAFQQVILDALMISDSSVSLVPKSGARIMLQAGDSMVMCTGQKNDNWKVPAFDEHGVFSVAMTSGYAPLCSLLPLCLTIEFLEGQSEKIGVLRSEMPIIRDRISALLSRQPDDRELQFESMWLMQRVLRKLFGQLKSDFLYRHEWIQEWYGNDMNVLCIFESLSQARGGTDAP